MYAFHPMLNLIVVVVVAVKRATYTNVLAFTLHSSRSSSYWLNNNLMTVMTVRYLCLFFLTHTLRCTTAHCVTGRSVILYCTELLFPSVNILCDDRLVFSLLSPPPPPLFVLQFTMSRDGQLFFCCHVQTYYVT